MTFSFDLTYAQDLSNKIPKTKGVLNKIKHNAVISACEKLTSDCQNDL